MLRKLVFAFCLSLVTLAILFPLHKGQTQPNRTPQQRKVTDAGRQVRTFSKTNLPENKLLTAIKAKGPALAPQPYAILDPETGKTTSRNGQPFTEKSIITLPNGKKMTAGEYYNKLNQAEAMLAKNGYSLRQLKSPASTANKNAPLWDRISTLTALSDPAVTDALTTKQAPLVTALHRKINAAQAKSALEKAVAELSGPNPALTGGTKPNTANPNASVASNAAKNAQVTPAVLQNTLDNIRKAERAQADKLNEKIKQKVGNVVKGGSGKGSGSSSNNSGGAGTQSAAAVIPGLTSGTVISRPVVSSEMGNKSYFAPYFRTSSDLTIAGYRAKAGVGSYVLGYDISVMSGDVFVGMSTGGMNARAALFMLDQQVYSYGYDAGGKAIDEIDETYNDTLSYPFSKQFSYSFVVGIIPVTVEFGVSGEAYISVNAALRPVDKLVLFHVSPGINVRADVKGIVDLEVAGGGFYGGVHIISDTLTFELDTTTKRMSCYNSLNAMAGEFGLYAFLWTPVWDLPPWEKEEWYWPWVKWKSPLQTEGFLVNESW
ncbi:MAG: hypothetical protein U0Y68_20290 [Blastocatellia bacterium]